ncbi:MAG: glutamate formimidoyltransferase [Candidatus Rokubacteria bacterium]|nr:glutamate formimidoyltransferase [Candidatus Rokubacteria bacterium]
MTDQILECVPNISEGQDRRVVERLAEAVRGTPGVRLVDIHMDPDHHRSVLTFLGAPGGVERAALNLAGAVALALDMRTHHGIHPRIGALDVLPFVPLRAMSMAEAVTIARRVGAVIGRAHDLPVYFYGAAALSPERRMLPPIRAGEYEGLPLRLADPAWHPDAGPARFNERLGATAVGAREPLVAFNVWLDSSDPAVARAIARVVRESSGGLSGVQAMGVPLARRGVVAVSMNLLDYRRTSVARAFDAVRDEAARRGIAVRRGELVGLTPRDAFEGREPESLGLVDFRPHQYLETHLPPDPRTA